MELYSYSQMLLFFTKCATSAHSISIDQNQGLNTVKGYQLTATQPMVSVSHHSLPQLPHLPLSNKIQELMSCVMCKTKTHRRPCMRTSSYMCLFSSQLFYMHNSVVFVVVFKFISFASIIIIHHDNNNPQPYKLLRKAIDYIIRYCFE